MIAILFLILITGFVGLAGYAKGKEDIKQRNRWKSIAIEKGMVWAVSELAITKINTCKHDGIKQGVYHLKSISN